MLSFGTLFSCQGAPCSPRPGIGNQLTPANRHLPIGIWGQMACCPPERPDGPGVNPLPITIVGL